MKKVSMRLHPKPFTQVKSGVKRIECRLYDEKRQQLVVGDVIEFQNRGDGELCERTIEALYTFPTFEDLFQQFPEERINNVYQYYTPEEEQEQGAIAIQFR